MSTNSTNADVPAPRNTSKPTAGSWLPFKIGYLVAALACLIQWGKPTPWLRVDVFSGGYLLMRALPVLRSIVRRARAPVTVERRQERWGSNAAPGWVNWALVLMLADFIVYLDYGQFHLVPSLQKPSAQAFGLLLHLAVALWKRWTDRLLGVAFNEDTPRPKLVQSGPFRYIRHPYYAAALLERIAVAFVFASLAGWLLIIPWSVLLVRQVQREESHLRKLFGYEYEQYSQHTAKLLPGIF